MNANTTFRSKMVRPASELVLAPLALDPLSAALARCRLRCRLPWRRRARLCPRHLRGAAHHQRDGRSLPRHHRAHRRRGRRRWRHRLRRCGPHGPQHPPARTGRRRRGRNRRPGGAQARAPPQGPRAPRLDGAHGGTHPRRPRCPPRRLSRCHRALQRLLPRRARRDTRTLSAYPKPAPNSSWSCRARPNSSLRSPPAPPSPSPR